MSIYVEILIRAPIDAVWAHTQTPALHEKWDLRFSRITYLPRASETDLQRFRYATRIGFGLEVSGEGESVGQRDLADGSRSSSLKFWSADRLSIIREGTGYWKYIPMEDGSIRFLTLYDYRTRFGIMGAIFDRWIFRPLLAWATAWSFDRLRLWLEEGVDPALAVRQTLVHAAARLALVCVFAYQGLIPKLVAQHSDEIAMLRDAGFSGSSVNTALYVVGIVEVAFAAALAFLWRQRGPLWLCLASMVIATTIVGVRSPRMFAGAFNPFTLNIGVVALAIVDLLTLSSVPSAAHCRRHPASGRS